MKKPLVLLVLLLALVAGGLFTVRALIGGGETAAGLAVEGAGAPAVEARPGAPVAELPDAVEPSTARVAEPDARPGGTLREVAGRVVLPEGAPPDPTLAVVARQTFAGDEDLNLATLVASDVARVFTPVELPEELARAAVGPDGAFTLEIPEGEALRLDLDGRYLYADPVSLAADAAETEPVLEAALGAWIVGRCTPPTGMGPTDAGLVGAQATLRGFAMMGGGGAVRRDGVVGEDLTFELRGLPHDRIYTLSLDPEVIAAKGVPFLQLSPGQKREVTVEFEVGATVRGRVVDTAGAALAGASVHAQTADEFAFFARNGRETETDEDGAFELRGLKAGEIHLVATSDTHAQTQLVLEAVKDREVREGIELTLQDGATLVGRVTWPDEKPVAGTTVTVSVGRGDDWPMVSGRGPREVETDDEGLFRIRGLDEEVAVDVHASAEHGDGEVWHVIADDLEPSDEVHVLTLEPPLTIAARVIDDVGSPVTTYAISFAPAPNPAGIERVRTEVDDAQGRFEVRLWKGSFAYEIEAEGYVGVRGTRALPDATDFVVTRAARVTGVVLDPQGRPVADAKVGELQPDFMGVSKDHETKTDASGHFSLGGFEPGELQLVANAEGYAQSEPVTIALESAGASEEVEIYLRMSGRLTGVIYRKTGEPDPGRTILLSQGMRFGMFGDTRTSDASGRFEFVDLAEGSYTVMAQPNMEEMLGGQEDGRSEAQRQADMLSQLEAESCEVRPGETTEVVLGEPPADPVVVSGRVTAAGEPRAESIIIVLAEGEASLLSSLAPALTDEQGRYELTVDAPGNYVFMVQGEMGSGTTFYETIPAVERHVVDLALPGGAIAGRVVGPDGAPVEDAHVSASREGGNLDLFDMDNNGESTDSDGRFRFDLLHPGTYRLRVRSSGEHGRASVGGITVKDGLTDDVEIRLAGSGKLEVVVRDAAGEPTESDVFVRDASGVLVHEISRDSTGKDGRTVISNLAPGSYTVCARTEDAASEEVGAVVIEGRQGRVELHLGPSAWLVVSTFDEEDEPVRAEVEITDAEGRAVHRMMAQDATEAFVLKGFSTTSRRFGPLPLGRYRIVAKTSDGRTDKASATLRSAGDERLVRMRLK